MDTNVTNEHTMDTAGGDVTNQSAMNMEPQGVRLDSLHQYATVAPVNQQVQPVYQQYPVSNPVEVQSVASQALSAGIIGLIVVATGTMGAHLHRVQDGEMKMSDAVTRSLAKGVAGGVAAAGATAVAGAVTSGGTLALAVTLATGTGISYLLNK